VAARPREHHRDLARADLGDHQQRDDHAGGRGQRGADAADEAGRELARPFTQQPARPVRRISLSENGR
jgi:hypothetical protein